MSKKTKKEPKEPGVIEQILSQMDFHGLILEQFLGKDTILKYLAVKFLRQLCRRKWPFGRDIRKAI